ncbi:tripartite tricarboxylate transporter substrate binding protein [Oxalobacteraceae bacterium CAVE-383]|nr:tripartite tricarboxylate transporter substrate binding protein [Oxalobacteraceae bacterium CAVE-383]
MLTLTAAAPAPAWAQSNYPNRAIKLIVTYPPGGGNDLIARLFAQKMTESMGQSVIVENRVGAGGTIGTSFVAKSNPDGYTIVLVSPPFVMAPTLYPNLPYDTLKDLTPVSVIGSVPNMLVVNPSLPVKSVKELIAFAHAKPSAVSAATLGSATTQHLAAALFNSMSKSDILLVPYKGSAPGINDLLAGHVQMMFNAMPSTLPYVKAGQLRALGVTGDKRSSMAPDLPTIAESLPGYQIATWYGILAPAGTPPAVVARLNAEIVKISQMPDIRQKLLDMGMDIEASSPAAFSALIKSEMAKWAEVMRVAHVTADN